MKWLLVLAVACLLWACGGTGQNEPKIEQAPVRMWSIRWSVITRWHDDEKHVTCYVPDRAAMNCLPDAVLRGE